jgi:multidrug resistance efflux pump
MGVIMPNPVITATLAALQAQINSQQAQIAALQAQIQDYQGRIASLRADVNGLLGIQQKFFSSTVTFGA